MKDVSLLPARGRSGFFASKKIEKKFIHALDANHIICYNVFRWLMKPY